MTYARARLWLGICGVGSLVLASASGLVFRIPAGFLSSNQVFVWTDLVQLLTVTLAVAAWLIPFDYLGGYQLPRKFYRSFESFGSWCRVYLYSALGQAVVFMLFATLILLAGRAFGRVGSLTVVCCGMLLCLRLRNQVLRARIMRADWIVKKVEKASELARSWKIAMPQTIVVKHRDVGFTGGIIGLGRNVQIVIPAAWLNTMSELELATAIARRAIAINSGSYAIGLFFAIGWNAFGFGLCTFLPSAGISSVAELVTTFCWFTVWSFFGLLILPTLSRDASLQIDQMLSDQGLPSHLIRDTAFSLDQMQDGETHRPKFIEAIFHPVPSVSSRGLIQRTQRGVAAWNVARTTLFCSWACFGVLSRAVHCNIGRPELWTMLPTD